MKELKIILKDKKKEQQGGKGKKKNRDSKEEIEK